MRTLGVVTVARSDYGLWRPVLRRIEETRGLRLRLLASGSHLKEVAADGFKPAARIDCATAGDGPRDVARAMGLAAAGFGAALERLKPDVLLVLGDRYEMHAAALAALPFNIPVAHVHGGELTYGAFDDALRHSITKLSHLHFTATRRYAGRVRQLGEEPWRITVSGSPAIDNLASTALLTRPELERSLGMDLSVPPITATFHPATLEYRDAPRQARALIAALKATGRPVVFTMPNADTNNRPIRALIRRFAAGSSRVRAFEDLGSRRYFSLLSLSAAMAGNSSSGLIEAPSFALPVVNVGTRQGGRLRARNVVDTGTTFAEISAGLRRALRPGFKSALKGLRNPYGRGGAAKVIVERLRTVRLAGLAAKRFADLGGNHG